MTRVWITVLLIVAPVGVNALPITLNAGESAIVNFDLSSASPPPPYDAVFSRVDFSGSGLYNVQVFTDLNGGGAVNRSFANISGTIQGLFLASDTGGALNGTGVMDGIFSWVFTITSGSFTLDSAYAEAGTGGVDTDRVGPTSVVVGVPEPSPLALLAAALLAFGIVTLRKRPIPVKLGDKEPIVC